MTPTAGGFAAFGIPVERAVFAPGFDLWQRSSRALRRVSRALMLLPDRGRVVRADDLPPEYFRFPPF